MEPRVLIVDDEPSMQRLFQAVLRECGYLADCVATTAEAEAALMRTRYCGMLLDYQLPGEDGLSFVRRWAAPVPLPPTVIITGQDIIPLRDQHGDHPAIKAIVPKPCELQTLFHLTQHYFDPMLGAQPDAWSDGSAGS